MQREGFVVARQLLPAAEVVRLLALVEQGYRVAGVELGNPESWPALEDPKLQAVWEGEGFPADRFPAAEARLVQNPGFLQAQAYFLTAMYCQPGPTVETAGLPQACTPSRLSKLDASLFTDLRWQPSPPTVTFPNRSATRVGRDMSGPSIGCNDIPAAFAARRREEDATPKDAAAEERQPWEPHAARLQVRALQRPFSVPVPMMAF
jgi:hypothetical protein